jgi:RNA polymerase sigma-70 factor (ECF subfamily)
MTIIDNDIVRTLSEDPERGFRMLMEKYEQPLYWHIRRLVVDYDDAKDVAQEAFVRIFRSFGQYHGGAFSAWMYKIATNEALRFLDRRKEMKLPLEGASEMQADEYFDYDDAEAIQLQHAIHSLPPKQQAAFNMRYYDELEYDEIALAVGSTATSVKTSYHIAKDKIIKILTNG